MTLIEWSYIATIVNSIAFIFVAYQIVLTKKQVSLASTQLVIARGQLTADHERSRRENAVSLILEWSQNASEYSSLARRVVESLSDVECRNLVNYLPTKISKNNGTHLKTILGLSEQHNFNVEGDFIVLDGAQVSKLRSLVISYLNVLEAILVAWQYSTADREIISHQFSYLFSQEKGHAALEKFRAAAGGEKSFPAIAIFSNHVDLERSKSLTQKANVV